MAWMHLTLVARNVFARKIYVMMLSLFRNFSPGPQVHGGGNSRYSHIQGRNRSRIALHVILNGRRNPTRC